MNHIQICAPAGHRDLFFPEQLLKYGVQIDRVDKKGRTPFGVTVAQRNYPVAEFLLRYGADRDYLLEGSTILALCLQIPVPLKGIRYLMTCKSNRERPLPSFVCSPGLRRKVFHGIAAAVEDAENTSVETRSIFQYLQEL